MVSPHRLRTVQPWLSQAVVAEQTCARTPNPDTPRHCSVPTACRHIRHVGIKVRRYDPPCARGDTPGLTAVMVQWGGLGGASRELLPSIGPQGFPGAYARASNTCSSFAGA